MELELERKWLAERRVQQLADIAAALRTAISDLKDEVKLPVAVPNRTEVRGVLKRAGANVVVTANINPVGRGAFALQEAPTSLPQIALLADGLRRCEIAASAIDVDPELVLELLDESLATVTSEEIVASQLFPNHLWTPHGTPPGVCCDLHTDGADLKLSVYTYQDRVGTDHYATSTLTATATDPKLSRILSEVSKCRRNVERMSRNLYYLETVPVQQPSNMAVSN